MAKNYIDNLSEETRKGMLEKAEQSIYPSFAPLGYRNVMGPNGKRIIEPDPDIAPIITQIFQWYGTGQCSIIEVTDRARQTGLVSRGLRSPYRNQTYISFCESGFIPRLRLEWQNISRQSSAADLH